MQSASTVQLPHRVTKGGHRLRPFELKNSREFRLTLLIALAHLPLGIVLYNAGSLAILHPIIVFAVGIYLALKKQVAMATVALAAGYFVGIEVLWRMAQVPTYWESGKYGTAAILVIALIRRGKFQIPLAPVAYFALLIPGCVLTFWETDFSRSVEILSSSISGPMLLAVSCWFFYKLQIRPFEFRRLLMATIIPLLCVAFTSLFYTVSAEEITFTGESNFATSGGFGPNQVSSMLGLGVYLSIAGFVLLKERTHFRIFFAASALLTAALSVLTFSRSGIYNAVGAIVVMLIFEFRNLSSGVKRAAPVLILATVFLFFLFPYLNTFTGGALQERFEDTGTTHRWEIGLADIEIFLENPIYGVGVGLAYGYRERFLGFKAMSHTEYFRLLAEHGLLGLGALAALVLMVFTNLRRPNSRIGKAFIAGAITWACLFMLNAGMRLAAPSFMFGMAYLTIAVSRPNRRLSAHKRSI